MGIVTTAIASTGSKIIATIIFLINTLFYFLQRTIAFPLHLDDDNDDINSYKSKYKFLSSSGNLNGISAFFICFLIVLVLIIVGDILFNISLFFYEFLDVYPQAIQEIKSDYDAEFFSIDSILDIVTNFAEVIPLILIGLIDVLIRFLFFIVFVCLIAQLLFLVISSLLYFLDLYILVRRNILGSSQNYFGRNLDIDQKDSLMVDFIAGLLIMPAASTFIIGAFIFVVGSLYQLLFVVFFTFEGSRIAVPLLNEIINLISAFFSIENTLGRIIRILIGLFWMIIGLSAFTNKNPYLANAFGNSIHDSRGDLSAVHQFDSTVDTTFIKNYALAFLLLFTPIISLNVIFYLRFIVIPL
ncbi:MAG: hypothetical protein ACXADY_25960 [Candidatus Hodarchaeales archaeon]|jgi:hypothetical protein